MKRRILFINGNLNSGGIERSLVDLLNHLDYSILDVDLMLIQGLGDYAEEIPASVTVYNYDTTCAYGPLLNTIFKLIKARRWEMVLYRFILLTNLHILFRLIFKPCRIKYDTVIAYRTGFVNHIAMKHTNAQNKISWWHHGEMNIYGNAKKELLSEYTIANHIIAVSKSCETMLKKEFPTVADKVSTIPNMLCSDIITQKAAEYKPVMSSPFNIVTIGRLSAEKNMSLCLKVSQELQKYKFPFHWYIIGDGADYQNLYNTIKEKKIENYCTLTGNLKNPYPYLKGADLYFHPSLVESQGLTILEAMALNKPVITVASNGPKEFIKNNENGIIINNNISEAVDAILKIRKGHKLDCKQTVESFNPQYIIDKFYEIL